MIDLEAIRKRADAARADLASIDHYVGNANSENRIDYSLYCGVVDNLRLAEVVLEEDIPALLEQLAATQKMLDAAVEDFTSAAHNGNILCEFCGADCIDAGNDTGGDTCQCGGFEWRGAKGGAK